MFSKLFAVKKLNLLDVSKNKLIFQKSDRSDTCKIWVLQQFQNLFTCLMKSLPGDAKIKIKTVCKFRGCFPKICHFIIRSSLSQKCLPDFCTNFWGCFKIASLIMIKEGWAFFGTSYTKPIFVSSPREKGRGCHLHLLFFCQQVRKKNYKNNSNALLRRLHNNSFYSVQKL